MWPIFAISQTIKGQQPQPFFCWKKKLKLARFRKFEKIARVLPQGPASSHSKEKKRIFEEKSTLGSPLSISK
jgi:hypothetical protein